MDETHPPDAWKRLGRALELRRWQLGYGFRQRGRFVRERGPAVSEKTVARFEQGARGAYPDATIAVIEALYSLQPGSLNTFLAGGELRPAEADGDGQLPRFSDPHLEALWRLPAKSAERPWGFTEEERNRFIELAMGMRAAKDAELRQPVPDTSDDGQAPARAG